MSLKIEQLIVLENGVILREDYHYIGLSSEYSTWMYLLNFMSHKEFKEIYSRLQGKVELPQLESLMELLEHHNQLVNPNRIKD